MRYPVIVHKDENSDYGIILPDFPGVFTGGATLEEALDNVQDAIETALDDEEVDRLPEPSSMGRVLSMAEAEGGAVAFAEVNFDFLERKTVPANITMPLYVRHWKKVR